MTEAWLVELHCDACTWHALCGPREIESRLRSYGHLRRTKEPDEALLRELLHGAAPQLVCPDCGMLGLRVAPYADDDDWAEARRCEACRKPIEPERLEALPGATRCLACQRQAESAPAEQFEPEYCPRCGAPLILKVSQGAGTTRYKLFCTGSPACRL
jgi:hypothetical protein